MFLQSPPRLFHFLQWTIVKQNLNAYFLCIIFIQNWATSDPPHPLTRNLTETWKHVVLALRDAYWRTGNKNQFSRPGSKPGVRKK